MELVAKFRGVGSNGTAACGAVHARIKRTRDSSVRPARRRLPLLLRRGPAQNSSINSTRDRYMNAIRAKPLRTVVVTVGITIAIAAIVAMVLLGSRSYSLRNWAEHTSTGVPIPRR